MVRTDSAGVFRRMKPTRLDTINGMLTISYANQGHAGEAALSQYFHHYRLGGTFIAYKYVRHVPETCEPRFKQAAFADGLLLSYTHPPFPPSSPPFSPSLSSSKIHVPKLSQYIQTTDAEIKLISRTRKTNINIMTRIETFFALEGSSDLFDIHRLHKHLGRRYNQLNPGKHFSQTARAAIAQASCLAKRKREVFHPRSGRAWAKCAEADGVILGHKLMLTGVCRPGSRRNEPTGGV
ncbi:hypothetical protein BaRGS_00002521 [Batillaria attramentaria]|uniref:Uncharacterized protein n=1 Tax=Batillaria attramentaria TaxID=370345 RepID=A0ABD0M4W1_9CAEN